MKSSKHPSRVILSGAKGAKAAPTASISKATAAPASSATSSGTGVSKVHAQGHNRSRSSSSRVHRYDKSGSGSVLLDATTDRATVAMIYRVLCSHSQVNAFISGVNCPPKPLEQLLPPLTSSNKVDLQLYALLAIIVKEYINSWYTKITPDHTLIDEIVKLFAHCTRAIEQRLRRVDIDALLLDALPARVESHIHVYHTLNPHPAFNPVPDPATPSSMTSQSETETIYRQLMAQGVLAVLLPTEDLENVCLQTILGDIMADLILGEVVSKKVCENYSIWEYLTKIFILIREKLGNDQISKANRSRGGASFTAATTGTAAESNSQKSRLEKFGLLAKPDLNDGSGSNVASATAVTAADGPPDMKALLVSSRAALSAFLWTVLQYLYLAFITIRFVATGIYRVYSSPKLIRDREGRSVSRPVTPRHGALADSLALSGINASNDDYNHKPPFISYHIFSMASTMLNLNQRMPWLESTGALIQHVLLEGRGRLGMTDSVLDRFCHETIQTYLFTPELIPTMLLATRAALFPGNRRQLAPPSLSTMPRRGTHSSSSSISSTAGGFPAIPTPESPKKGFTSNSKQGLSTTKSAVPASTARDESYRPSEVEIKSIRRACAAAFSEIIPQKLALSFFCPDLPSGARQQPLTGSFLQPPLSSNQKTGVQTVQAVSSPARAGPSSAAQGLAAASPAIPATDELLLQEIEQSLLDLFSDSYCNKHLIFSIIESLLTDLFPELSEKCVSELMSERGL
ncbi:hypothetical protein KEM56_006621 [Ascosphaera pollenicola]|nr:hypothetical protein KEM56_006621 [Ascosphaera pollenicola]